MSTTTTPPPLPAMSTTTMPPPSPEMSTAHTAPPSPDSNTLHNIRDVFQSGHTEIALQSICGPCGSRVARICMPACCVKLVVISIIELLVSDPAKNEMFHTMLREVIVEEAEQDYQTRLQAYEAAVAAVSSNTTPTKGTDTTTVIDSK
ncbi:uncharacterized protein F5891DRAFT_1180644 [Suillus fuscotomentosus]|uniref:Uncharacterized protein n=1 Tax=Suillus fuscotomentosus TaxID=1912939 RepID=A0AAD4EKB3_9AGAM|nr:uncharacterized protein F5891DRAFT_1180644 [Suillus fuscotomentosus]KAG1907621.1 hypothetical protein F5891DRAFT_1180644 [Suillus fuscotomentosus]